MQTLAELIKPFFDVDTQGRNAVRQARDVLNMDKFEREVQTIREKKAEDQRKREGNLKIGLDLLGSGYAPNLAFGQQWMDSPQSLATLPNIKPSIKDMAGNYTFKNPLAGALAKAGFGEQAISAEQKFLSDQADNAARVQAAQSRGAGAASALQKFQLDTIAQAQGSVNPALQAIIGKLGQARGKETGYKQTIDALKKQEPVTDMNAIQQYADSLGAVGNEISTLRGDSTNIMNLLRAGALGQLPQSDITDEELEEFWLNQ